MRAALTVYSGLSHNKSIAVLLLSYLDSVTRYEVHSPFFKKAEPFFQALSDIDNGLPAAYLLLYYQEQ